MFRAWGLVLRTTMPEDQNALAPRALQFAQIPKAYLTFTAASLFVMKIWPVSGGSFIVRVSLLQQQGLRSVWVDSK